MRILLTGKYGQLGWEIHRQLEQDYDVIAIDREDIDFLDSRFLASIIRRLPKLGLIINAASYTDIEQAERRPYIAEAVNAEAAAILASESDFRGIPMIHFSTDHVFDGRRRKFPYRESDTPNPVSVYGWSKLEGEKRVRNIAEKHLIFRISSLYGIRRKNFFTSLLNHQGTASRVANDQFISPNWTPLTAEAVAEVIKRLCQGETFPWGVYHLSGNGSTTWYEFARLITEKVNDWWGGDMPLPILSSLAKFKTIAKRPKYSVLDSTRFNNTFHHTLPDWREQFLRFFGGLQPNL